MSHEDVVSTRHMTAWDLHGHMTISAQLQGSSKGRKKGERTRSKVIGIEKQKEIITPALTVTPVANLATSPTPATRTTTVVTATLWGTLVSLTPILTGCTINFACPIPHSHRYYDCPINCTNPDNGFDYEGAANYGHGDDWNWEAQDHSS
jgi:hypothetical protein